MQTKKIYYGNNLAEIKANHPTCVLVQTNEEQAEATVTPTGIKFNF